MPPALAFATPTTLVTGGDVELLVLAAELFVAVVLGTTLGGAVGVLTLPLVHREGGWLLHREGSGESGGSSPELHLLAATIVGAVDLVLAIVALYGLAALGVSIEGYHRGFTPVVGQILAATVLGSGGLLAAAATGRDRGVFAAVRPVSALALRHLAAYLTALTVVVSALVVALDEGWIPGMEFVLLVAFLAVVGAVAGGVLAVATLPLVSRGWGRLLQRKAGGAGDPDPARHIMAGVGLGAAYLALATAALWLAVTEPVKATLSQLHPTAPVLMALTIAACLLATGLPLLTAGIQDAGIPAVAELGAESGPLVSRLEGFFVATLAVLAGVVVLMVSLL